MNPVRLGDGFDCGPVRHTKAALDELAELLEGDSTPSQQ